MLIAAAAAFLAAASSSYATTTINGSYTATASGTNAPYVNYDPAGGTYYYFAPSFTQTLTTVGSTTTASPFIELTPQSSGSGTVSGSVAVALTLTDASNAAVTSFSYTNGGDAVTLTNGVLNITANYDIYYAASGVNAAYTDCVVWNAASCSTNVSTSGSTTLGETVTATFADGEVLALNLYNWADWDMEPNISFTFVAGPTVAQTPEPASIAVFGSGLIGLAMIRRRLQGGGKSGHRHEHAA
jgi:hypothetical protein